MAFRRDFYQTDTHVHVSIYVRNLRKESVQFRPEAQGFSVFASADLDKQPAPSSAATPVQSEQSSSDDKNVSVVLSKLFAPIEPSQSSYKAYPNKIELHLAKVQVGVHWPYLNNDQDRDEASSAPASSQPSTSATSVPQINSVPTPVPASTAVADAPKRKRNKWENFKVDDDDDAASDGAQGEGGKGGADVNDFFKQLYAGASEDARRAMIKSYQESNGTTLSMNWDEVKRGKVETRPPDSMVSKKYGE